MGKRKYAKIFDKNITKYECTKRNCKWQGTYDEKSSKKLENGFSELICPKCGNNEFYGILPTKIET